MKQPQREGRKAIICVSGRIKRDTVTDFEAFHYLTIDDLNDELGRLGIQLPRSDNFRVLFEPVEIGPKRVPNRFVIQPMEGCDSDADGTPSELVRRRYRRFSEGGAGLIWFEACAIVPEARANPHQMMITERNWEVFARLLDDCRKEASGSMGELHQPLFFLQLTHSGRYSRPEGRSAPIISQHSGILDALQHLPDDYPLITDEELSRLQDAYVRSAQLAARAGFDGVDVKACHGYLLAELLSSFTREDSRYGGDDFENRTRMLRETHQRVSTEAPGLIVSSRFNAYDPIPFPYGWGNDRDDFRQPDSTEPIRLAGELKTQGAPCLNVTLGNPYYMPHYNRPYDTPTSGAPLPDEHPLQGVSRILDIARQIQVAHPDLKIIGTGYTYFRQFMPWFAAGVVKEGWASLIGMGRAAFAYPDFVKDLSRKGAMDPLKTCITCSSCTQIMRDGGRSGCVIRDDGVYGPIFREGRRWVDDIIRRAAERCQDCIAPTCQAGCPAHVDVPAFVRAASEGEFERSYRILRESNPLPELCAFLCPADVQCEGRCIERTTSGLPVPIQDIQRYVCRLAREKGWTSATIPEESSGRRVAVVGAGPSGMACALRLLEMGHLVTIIEASDAPGGVARQMIPNHRLTHEDFDQELRALLSSVGESRLTWRTRTVLGKDITLEDLLKYDAGFDAVYLGLGLMKTLSLVQNGKRIHGVESAFEFLKRTKTQEDSTLPDSVAVLGGGNSAMDAAVTAKLRGTRDVYLIYRRSFEEMPAWLEERKKALETGVHFLILSQPKGYVADENSRLTGLRVCRTVLGEPDKSSRRRPLEVPNSEYVLEAQLVIEALGQMCQDGLPEILQDVAFTENGLVRIDEDTMQTTRPRVYAGGDIVNGGRTIVQAISDGMKAASSIDRLTRDKIL